MRSEERQHKNLKKYLDFRYMRIWRNVSERYTSYCNAISEFPSNIFDDIERILVFGMGGSGIIGKFLEILSFELLDIPIISFNTTKLPKYVSEKDFCMVISYSGNTRETLSVYSDIVSRNLKHICITSNGKLSEICENTILVEKGFLPREAFADMLSAALSVVSKITEIDFSDSLREFEKKKEKTEISLNSNLKEPVIIYSWYLYYPVALRFKQQLNENCKIQSYSQKLPEAAHNEIEGVKNGSFIVVRGSKEEKKYVDTFIEVLPKKPIQIKIEDKNYLIELLLMFYIVDKISIDIANSIGIDWRITERIKRYKDILR